MKSLLTLFSCILFLIVHAQIDTVNYAGFHLCKNEIFIKRKKVTLYKINGKEVSEAAYEKAFARVDAGKQGIKKCKPCWLRYYDENERLIQEGLCYQDCGVGKVKEYFPDGKLKSEGSYKVNNTGSWDNLFDKGYCSVKDGLWISYNEEGTIIKTESYKDGELITH